jgi:hypothetical protein
MSGTPKYMSRGPCPFSDVKRAIKAAQDMGLTVTGYVIEDGKISVTTGRKGG